MRVTPSLAGSTSATRGPSRPAHGDDEQGGAVGEVVVHRDRELAPGDALALEPGRWLGGQRHPDLVESRGHEQVAGDDPRHEDLLLLRRTGRRERQQPAHQGLPDWQVERARSHLAHEDRDLGEPEALPAVLRRRGETEQPGLRAGGPAGLDLGRPLVEHVGEHRADLVVEVSRHVVAHVEPLGPSENCNLFSLGIARTTATTRTHPWHSQAAVSVRSAARCASSPASRWWRSRRGAGWTSLAAAAPGSPSSTARPAPSPSCCSTLSAAPACSLGSRWSTSSRSATTSWSSTSAGTVAASSRRTSRCTTAPTTWPP